MDTGAIVAIAVVAVLLVALATLLVGRRRHEQAVRQEKLRTEAAGHSEQADVHLSKAERAHQEADIKEAEARRVAEEAAQARQAGVTSEQHAERHAERATGAERQLKD
jgi:uncharacterized protein YlxW (UPF0749 family)